MSNQKGYIFFISFSVFCGVLLLCGFSTFQKQIIGASLSMKGYIVPVVFGGIFGGIIGFYFKKINEYNLLLKERVNTLESFLPICSHCKKIRKPDSAPDEIDSWEQMESYISKKTSSQFSHSICPGCMEKLYGDDMDEDQ